MLAGPKHKAFRDDLLQLLMKHGQDLNDFELLALASHMVGQILALQDQRTMTPEAGMALILENIQQGNAEAIAECVGGAPHGHA